MKKTLLILSVCLITSKAFAWGKNGHRIVAEIAQQNLSVEAKKGVKDILGDQDLARVSTWPDEVRSDKSYDYATPWHYVSIPNGKTYFDQKRAPNGDVIFALFQFEETLRDKKATKEQKKDALRFMVHMMGDLHQPLHVGLAEDKGGNAVKIKWFKAESNLHALWDEGIIDFEQLSYTEYTKFLNFFSKDDRSSFEKGTFLDWATESQELRPMVYNVPNDTAGYEYHFQVKPIYEKRLRQAGLRLATVLNKIFKNEKLDKTYLELRQKVKDNI